MKHGFIKVQARSLPIRVADCAHNAALAAKAVEDAGEQGVQLLCLQQLGITGAACGSLYLQDALLEGALQGLSTVLSATENADTLVIVGLPLAIGQKIYDCAAVLQRGRILGVVPGTFGVAAPFTPAPEGLEDVTVLGQTVPFGTDMIFACGEVPSFTFAVEVGKDAFAPLSPGGFHADAGAMILCRPAADEALVGAAETRKNLLSSRSRQLCCGYLSCSAGEGETTTDGVFCGETLIFEGGEALSATTELDVCALASARRTASGFRGGSHLQVPFSLPVAETGLTRAYDPYPFASSDPKSAEEALSIQAAGLRKRLSHTGAKKVVLGLSGGLDSTLALLAAVRTMDTMGRSREDILAVTLPCFGTTGRTRSNAEKLAEALGVSFREIPVGPAVEQHFRDIGLPETDRSATYENGQARERTQVLMDLAGMEGGMVLGTGDMSEMALGWCTYNGDHMSMYGINSGVTKTMAKSLVRYEANRLGGAVKAVLEDILDTPISPELLPPEEGAIAQKTEDLVGPYELHDFFLWHRVKNGFSPEKILRLALHTWGKQYDEETVRHWLSTFCRRFCSQQFKRSCMPDGVQVTEVSLSPRGGFAMPSDVCSAAWLKEI